MQKHETTLAGFQFRRATADLIQVFNAGSYLMAEYSERTGSVSWYRLLLAGQREIVERSLRDRYPGSGTAVAQAHKNAILSRSRSSPVPSKEILALDIRPANPLNRASKVRPYRTLPLSPIRDDKISAFEPRTVIFSSPNWR